MGDIVEQLKSCAKMHGEGPDGSYTAAVEEIERLRKTLADTEEQVLLQRDRVADLSIKAEQRQCAAEQAWDRMGKIKAELAERARAQTLMRKWYADELAEREQRLSFAGWRIGRLRAELADRHSDLDDLVAVAITDCCPCCGELWSDGMGPATDCQAWAGNGGPCEGGTAMACCECLCGDNGVVQRPAPNPDARTAIDDLVDWVAQRIEEGDR